MIVTDVVVLLVLAMVWVVGWWEAALFGLAVLLVMNLAVLAGRRMAASRKDEAE